MWTIAHLFFDLWATYIQNIAIEHHEHIFQIVGILSIVYSLFKYRHYIAFWLLVATTITILVFVFDKCVYGCVECMFEKLILEGVCVEVSMRSGGIEATYYQCDPRLIKKQVSKGLTKYEL